MLTRGENAMGAPAVSAELKAKLREAFAGTFIAVFFAGKITNHESREKER